MGCASSSYDGAVDASLLRTSKEISRHLGAARAASNRAELASIFAETRNYLLDEIDLKSCTAEVVAELCEGIGILAL